MKILLYQLLPEMPSHLLPLMLSILPTAERRSSVREIETGRVVVVAIRTGIGIGIVVIVIVPERQTTITTIDHGGGSMNETMTTSIEAMISMANLDGMKMSIVLGIVIVTSAIVIGNPDRTGQGTETETETEETETEATETEEAKMTEETETGRGNEETGREETGRGETGRGETGIKETETEETGNEETGRGETETERKTERNLFSHPRLMKAPLLRRQLVTLLDPSSKKCLLLTLTATVTVLYLHLQRQAQALDLV
jgi:hypothetical protein